MSLGLRAIRDALSSHAARLGHFDRVSAHEVLNPPGRGLTAQVLIAPGGAGPARSGSGLSSTSPRLVLLVRLLCSADRDPRDDIDIDLGEAADALCVAISGDDDLGGTVRGVDLLGNYGIPLGFVTGYQKFSDNSEFRVFDVTVPVIVNDAWEQVA